jgi:hypothetical protein
MHKRFEAPTRGEAITRGEEWLKSQPNVKQTTRFVFAVGDGPALSEMHQWVVVVHYERLRPPELPIRDRDADIPTGPGECC